MNDYMSEIWQAISSFAKAEISFNEMTTLCTQIIIHQINQELEDENE